MKPMPRYPIYVISKGRWESRLTVKSLDECGLPYRVVIEPQEYDAYAAVLPPGGAAGPPVPHPGRGPDPAPQRGLGASPPGGPPPPLDSG